MWGKRRRKRRRRRDRRRRGMRRRRSGTRRRRKRKEEHNVIFSQNFKRSVVSISTASVRAKVDAHDSCDLDGYFACNRQNWLILTKTLLVQPKAKRCKTRARWQLFLRAHPVVGWTDPDLAFPAVLDEIQSLIEKSRRLIIVLSKSYLTNETRLELESGLHEALVERKIKIILIEFTPAGSFAFLPPSLKLLKPCRVLKWQADKSLPYNSRFWKNLLYLMPAKAIKPWRDESEALPVLSTPWSSARLHVRRNRKTLRETVRVPNHSRGCRSKYRILCSSPSTPS